MSELREEMARVVMAELWGNQDRDARRVSEQIADALITAGLTSVRFTAMDASSRFVAYRMRVEGNVSFSGGRYAEGSGMTECHIEPTRKLAVSGG